jgi:hypothetical protein
MALYDAVAQHHVFSRKQPLREFIAAFVHVTLRAREMIIDAQTGGATEIIGKGKNFIGGRAVIYFPLSKRTSRADCE